MLKFGLTTFYSVTLLSFFIQKEREKKVKKMREKKSLTPAPPFGL